MIDAIHLSNDKVTWACGSCWVDNETKVSTLELGADGGPDVICLPACNHCGAREFLFRTWDDKADYPHRRAINSLAQHLRAQGQSHHTVKDLHGQEKSQPALLHDLSNPIEDLTGRKAGAIAERRRLIATATRLASKGGERPSLEAVQKHFDALVEDNQSEGKGRRR